MLKKVAILNGEIVNIYHSEDELNEIIIDGASIEEREMEYSSLYGWVEAGFVPPKSEVELLKEQNIELRGTIDFILTDLIPSLFE